MKRIVISIILSCLVLVLNAQTKFFTTDNGLSSSLVNKIFQDRNGMIWIATEDGLNRYDGSKITIYKNNPIDQYSLCHNFVNTLFEDKDGRLFVGTYNGIQVYNPETDSFSENAIWNDGKPFRSNGASFIQLKNGEIWVSGNMPCKLTVENGQPIASPIETTAHSNNNIEEIIQDESGRIWMIYDTDKLCKINVTGHISYYMNKEPKPGFTSLAYDAQGNIYAGSLTKGLMKYDETKGEFIPVIDPNDRDLPVMTIYIDDENKIYVGTDGKGTKTLESNKNTLIDHPIDISGLNSKLLKVHSILKDKDGNQWFAIFQKGVVMIPASRNNFNYYGYKSTMNDLIGSNCITSIVKDHEGDLWVGTDNDGIYTIKAGNSKHYSSLVDKSGVPSTIMSLFEDSEKTLWIGGYNVGMGWMDKKSGTFRYVPIRNQQGNIVERIYDFAEDNEKRLWIATMGNGIYCYNIQTKKIIENGDVERMVQSAWITNLYYSSKSNKLYIGSYDGIGCADLNTDNFHTTWDLRRQIILDIYEDKNGNIWLGTSDGLVEWNLERGLFITYNISHGLPSNAIYAIQGDKEENLWLSTNMGLAQFNIDSHKVTNYYVTDGLQGNEFSKAASYQDMQGNIYFGGVNGITHFSPKEIVSPNKKWGIRVTDFYLSNTPVRKGDLSGNKAIIDCAIYDAEEFHLNYKDNTFSIELSTIELNAPERITYSYTIDGENWMNLPKGINYISFNNLAPGNYQLQIKAIDNVMESDIKNIKIHIRSPWWYSWWAIAGYICLGVVFLTALLLLVRRRK